MTTSLDPASAFIIQVEMKSLVLLLTPGAAAIAQRVVARCVGLTVRCCSIRHCFHLQKGLLECIKQQPPANFYLVLPAASLACCFVLPVLHTQAL